MLTKTSARHTSEFICKRCGLPVVRHMHYLPKTGERRLLRAINQNKELAVRYQAAG